MVLRSSRETVRVSAHTYYYPISIVGDIYESSIVSDLSSGPLFQFSFPDVVFIVMLCLCIMSANGDGVSLLVVQYIVLCVGGVLRRLVTCDQFYHALL